MISNLGLGGGKPPEVFAPGGSKASAIVSGGGEYDRRASQIRSEPLLAVDGRPHAEGPLQRHHVEAEWPLRHRHRVHAMLFRPPIAFAPAQAARTTIVHPAVHALAKALTPAEALGAIAADAAQQAEAPLLAVVEAAVERPRGVGQFLERRAGLGHLGGALLHALHRVSGAGPSVASRVDPRIEAI